MTEDIIEAVARAIYDAPLEISGGDTIAEIVHHCEWINDTEPLDAQLAQVREVCQELARAAITAYEAARGDVVVVSKDQIMAALVWDGHPDNEHMKALRALVVKAPTQGEK